MKYMCSATKYNEVGSFSCTCNWCTTHRDRNALLFSRNLTGIYSALLVYLWTPKSNGRDTYISTLWLVSLYPWVKWACEKADGRSPRPDRKKSSMLLEGLAMIIFDLLQQKAIIREMVINVNFIQKKVY